MTSIDTTLTCNFSHLSVIIKYNRRTCFHLSPIMSASSPVLMLAAENNLALSLTQLLEEDGYSVAHAANGDECFNLLTSLHPDLLILDADLQDAFSLVPRLLADYALPVLFLIHESSENKIG